MMPTVVVASMDNGANGGKGYLSTVARLSTIDISRYYIIKKKALHAEK